MANNFIHLPTPAGNGSGAWTDCSAMGALRDITVGGTLGGSVVIEVSNEAVASSPNPVALIVNSGQAQVLCAAKWMRATISGYKGGSAAVEVGSDDEETQIANLAVTAGDGTAAPTDVSAMPLVKTITVGGVWTGSVILEYSEDTVNFFPLAVLTQPGIVTKKFWATDLRVTRSGVKPVPGPGTPLVDVGASSDGGGSSGSFGKPTIQRFVAAGGEQSFMVTLDVPRAVNTYSVWPTQAGMADIVGIDCPDIAGGDRTATQFAVVVSSPLTAGDTIDFLIADR